ncbi:MAG TPA: hypothetical protein VJR89_19120 [Polyangiales bacterium]|nr:hypothetical protein [Polyangiales bacterium]
MRQLWGACAVALVACASSGGRETPVEGRGTATCRLWQDSVCDWAERCSAITRAMCDNQFQGVTCKSDAVASECAAAFDRSPCTSVPPRCGLDEIADPEPATQACDTLRTRYCKRAVECNVWVDEAVCLQEEKVDCSRSIAYGLDYETCLQELDDLDCGIVLLPDICARVIVSRAEQTQ